MQALGSGAIGQALGDQFGNLELTSTQTAWRSSPGGRALGEFDPVLNGQLTSSRPGLFGCGISNERIRLAPCLFQLLKPKVSLATKKGPPLCQKLGTTSWVLRCDANSHTAGAGHGQGQRRSRPSEP